LNARQRTAIGAVIKVMWPDGKELAAMGVIEFAAYDLSMMMAQDEQIAQAFDAERGSYLVPLPELPEAAAE
jgi:hypothetical protein